MDYSANIPLLNVDQSYMLKNYGDVQTELSKAPLADKSVIVTTRDGKRYVDWTEDDSSHAFTAFKEIANVWQQIGLSDQYLVYGKQSLRGEDQSFRWEAVPYYHTTNWFSEVWQQLVVLFKIAVGGLTASEETLREWTEEYTTASSNPKEILLKQEQHLGENVDAFCNPKVINNQWILEGDKVRVLYSYAPLGEEKLHFLFMPKRHEPDFNKFTEEEYLEIADLSKKMIVHLSEKYTQIEEVHFFRKFGKDAGQTEFHGHLHMVLTASKTDNFWSYLKVACNILFFSPRLSDADLKIRVEGFRNELTTNFNNKGTEINL
ncbi:MAG: HIT domain-containing protein [Parachlamydiaceae bacterium]|nr:HIT domain-containing protein [Parachlamydiaceae bacterium]